MARLGTKDAVRFVLALLPISAIGGLALSLGVSPIGLGLPLVAVPHAMVLAWLLLRYLRSGAPDGRIDGLIALALLYIGWFVIIPVIDLAESTGPGRHAIASRRLILLPGGLELTGHTMGLGAGSADQVKQSIGVVAAGTRSLASAYLISPVTPARTEYSVRTGAGLAT